MRHVVGNGGWRRVWSLGNVVAIAVAAMLVASVPSARVAADPDYGSLESPARLADTRPGAATADGQFAGIGERAAGSTLELTVAGRVGVPLDAAAVVLTVTAVDSVDPGYVTVHPTGTARPNASNVNYYAAHNTANTVIARVGTGGAVSIFVSAATHLIVDVSGYFPVGTYTPLPAPARLADTRPGAATVDGLYAGTGLRAAGSTLDVTVASRAGIPGGATVAVLTVTAVDSLDAGFVTVHPYATNRPNASNVNYYGAHNTANLVVARIGVDGKVSFFTSAATHLIVDVSGHLPVTEYVPLPAPARLADSRPTGTTVDGYYAGLGPVNAGYSYSLWVAGRAGLPEDASAAVLTVTAVDPESIGYSTVHPRGTERPTASDLNVYPGHNVANTVIARLGVMGDVCIFTAATTHYVVDVSGYFTGPAPPDSGSHCHQPSHAIWPVADVYFDTPEEAAADFVTEVLGVEPVLGEFVAEDSTNGFIEVFSPGEDDDPTTNFLRGELSLSRILPTFGWFVTGATSDWATINSPSWMDAVPPGTLTVYGLAEGFEDNILVSAFFPGDASPIDSTFTTAPGFEGPAPYSATLDLSGVPAWDVVVLLVRGDTGLDADPGNFAALPVQIFG